jgi:hypothetical protein
VVGIEDGGASLERGRDSILERHVEDVKSYFNKEDNLDSLLDRVWSEDNEQTTSNTRQKRKKERQIKIGQKNRIEQEPHSSCGILLKPGIVEPSLLVILHQKSFKRREDEWQTRVLKDMTPSA